MSSNHIQQQSPSSANNPLEALQFFRSEPSAHREIPINVEVKRFAEEASSPDIEKISALTQALMIDMNHSFPGLPPDSLEKTRALVTQPGAHTVILRGKVPGDPSNEERILGYGIIIKGAENFPDKENIPPYLLEKSSASRVIRLFVTDEMRRMLPDGEAFSILLKEIQKIGGEGPIIGMVLTNIEIVEGSAEKDKSIAIWLEARRALAQRGFDDTGKNIQEDVEHQSGAKVRVDFGWWVYPPDSESAKQTEQDFHNRTLELKRTKAYGLSCIATSVPAENALIVVHGSQRSAYDVARLYPENFVFAGNYRSGDTVKSELRSNLAFTAPDKTLSALPPSYSADALLFLGVLPDIANKDPLEPKRAVKEFIIDQLSGLKAGKELVIRDTVAPSGNQTVIASFSPEEARKFKEFVATARESHIASSDWGNVIELRSHSGSVEFITPNKIFVEYFLKSFYPRDRQRERGRSYTLFTSSERKDLNPELGLRLLYAGPEHNPLMQERFHRDFELFDLERKPLPAPPTNYTTIAEKVNEGEGVVIRHQSSRPSEVSRFMHVVSFLEQDRATGETLGIKELAFRDTVAHDVVGYQLVNGKLFVRCRIFPRPLLATIPQHLDGSTIGGYVPEQVAGLVSSQNFIDQVSADQSARDILVKRSGLKEDDIIRFGPVRHYYSYPEMLSEEVCAQAVEIQGDLHDLRITDPIAHFSPTITIRMCDAEKFLHGCQVGGVQDPRVERVIYDIMRAHKIDPGLWMGENIDLEKQGVAPLSLSTVAELQLLEPTHEFVRHQGGNFGFFVVREESFEELDSKGNILGTATRESVAPKDRSPHAVSLLPVIKAVDATGVEEVYVGLEVKQLPSMHNEDHTLQLLSAPLFLIPKESRSIVDAKQDAVHRFEQYFSCRTKQLRDLGSKWAISPGVTSGFVYPVVAEVDASSVNLEHSDIKWVKLSEAMAHIDQIKCGQLITALNRLNHALSSH